MTDSKRDVLITLAAILIVAIPSFAGPVEFGSAEFQRALAQRGLPPTAFSLEKKLVSGKPECFTISGTSISASDKRGLMYAFLDAADQIRANGRVSNATGCPAVAIRGIRYFLHNHDLEQQWYYSRDYWDEYFAMLAHNRFNRFNLVFAWIRHCSPHRAKLAETVCLLTMEPCIPLSSNWRIEHRHGPFERSHLFHGQSSPPFMVHCSPKNQGTSPGPKRLMTSFPWFLPCIAASRYYFLIFPKPLCWFLRILQSKDGAQF